MSKAAIFLTLLLTVSQAFALVQHTADMSVEQNSPTSFQLSINVPDAEVEEYVGKEILRIPGEGVLGVAGCPDLPLLVRPIRIEPGRAYSAELVEAQWTSLGVREICPRQERLHEEIDLPLPWIEEADVFGADAFWPNEALTLSEPVLVRETRMLKLMLAPYRYNPITGELQKLEHATIELRDTGSSSVNNPTRSTRIDDPAGRAAERAFTRSLIRDDRLVDLVEINAPEAGDMESIEWERAELPLNYLVFAPASAMTQTALLNYLEWKRQRGHYVEVITDADISFTSTNIRNAIMQRYETSSHPPHYVMLVGDTNGTYTVPTGGGQYDHFYATVAGSDILADVVVGRMSVSSANELAGVCNKLRNYEAYPYTGDTNWLRRASFLTGSGHCGESMSQLCRMVAHELVEERGYTQIDTAWCANSPSYVYNWINQGISFYTYRGWIGMENLSQSTLINLSQGPRMPVAVVFTCSSGEFDSSYEVAFSEAFLRGGDAATAGGAVAGMGFCTTATHTEYNNVVVGGFYAALLDYDIHQVGTCMFRGKYDLWLSLPEGDSATNGFSYWGNLMGDPGMEMLCGVPAEMTMSTDDNQVYLGSESMQLSMFDDGGDPLPGITVCAYQPSGLQSVGVTGQDGTVVLWLTGLQEEDLTLTATRADYIPVIQTLSVVGDLAAPVLDELNGTGPGGSSSVRAGELLTLSPVFANASETGSLSSMTVTLVDGVGYQVVDGSTGLDAIPAGGTATVTAPLSLQVDSDYTTGDDLVIRFELESGSEMWHLAAEKGISSPALLMDADGPEYTAFNPGGSSDVNFTLTNHSLQTAAEVTLYFSVNEGSGFELDIAERPIGTIAGFGQYNAQVEVTADGGLVAGYTSVIHVDWETMYGERGRIEVPVTLGTGAITDPTGPDEYGYMGFEDDDNQWLQAPAFSWIEIAPNAGGDGTVLSINDYGNEQDDATLVDLPFTFVLYGQPYNIMGVCSNGFVSFGPNSHLETDFRNHYLPAGMGPEPMLAPMWDDFFLGGNAQICGKYLEDAHIYVVEWYRVLTNSNQAVNTFQLLLYDPAFYPTDTGDGEVIFQYQTFSDTQSNSQDFPYCTVGIKDHTGTRGLTLTCYHERPSTAHTITDETAIRFTTTVHFNVEPPVLSLIDESILFQAETGSVVTLNDSIRFTNEGTGNLAWLASLEYTEDWPPAEQRASGSDQYGYTWMDSDEDGGPQAGWVDISDVEIPVSLTHNDSAVGPLSLGFDFSFYGDTYNQFWINPNGFLSFEEAHGYFQNNVGLPSDQAPETIIAPWWDDLLTNAVLNDEDWITWYSNNSDSLIVCYNNVPHFNPNSYGGPFTFQIILEGNGRITFNYGDMSSSDPNSDSGTIGIQGSSTLGMMIAANQTTAVSDRTIRIRPPHWLALGSVSGIVPSGGSGHIPLVVNTQVSGFLYPEDDYSVNLLLATNDPDHRETTIPITLHIGEVSVSNGDTPVSFGITKVYPNPFNPTTTVQFTLPAQSAVDARLFNLLGQEVAQLVDQPMAAGQHTLQVDGSRLASGVYMLRLAAGSDVRVHKLMLMK